MDQFERIKVDIEDSRADLQGNLRELERKVGDAADWRYQFRQRPYVLLGAAAAAGAVLGALAGPRRVNAYRRSIAHDPTPHSASNSGTSNLVPQAWENIKAALVGVAAARLQDMMEGVLPGFKHHYHAAEQRGPGFIRAT